MKFYKNLIVFINGFLIQCCLCSLYSSSFEISRLLETEKKILDKLDGFFVRQEKNGLTFDSNVKEFVHSAQRENSEFSKTENPISVFHLLTRTVHEWEELTKNLSCDEEQEKCPILTGADIINVNKRRESTMWPTGSDVSEAAKAILNVWTFYDLDLEKIIKGNLFEISERPLSADNMFLIANVARDSGMTYEAITWFEYLLQRLETLGSFTFKTSALYRRLATAYKENGMLTKAIGLLQEYLNMYPNESGVARDYSYFKSSASKDDVKEVVRFAADDKSKLTKSRQAFEGLCRSSLQTRNYLGTLQCYMLPLYNCYGLAKVEMISKCPNIQILYDVMTSNESDEIISYGEKAFGSFHELFPFRTKSLVSDHGARSGPMCEWNQNFPLIVNLTRRLEQMTRYHMYPVSDVSSSECYTMTNEGPGVIHRQLLDAWPKNHNPYPFAGNRLATIMLQLSDVQYGGAVVFPKLNLTVPVQKGSAVIWRNLKSDGTPSARAIHSSCPVITGSRWTIYKHVLYNNQLFREPCEAR
ncbi:prolyl 4-hydroxylase subunit alpha-1-like [Ruditapes philippinarum]|uniref:prolyl 4-hydroxylase subunit alpha-1-like n=1 Tax=Ruditapes philippinarum TaxID=129788 RepID=UPI00295C079E|nr:prolyl 4-hydroxylase subunit alpha-1-like [Ruditapes philippinarum]